VPSAEQINDSVATDVARAASDKNLYKIMHLNRMLLKYESWGQRHLKSVAYFPAVTKSLYFNRHLADLCAPEPPITQTIDYHAPNLVIRILQSFTPTRSPRTARSFASKLFTQRINLDP
jgi:hypothetical protein